MQKDVFEFAGPYRFLSNFWPSEISAGGTTYPTVEHAYQAAKLNDPELKARIARTRSGREAKHFAYAKQDDWRPDWDACRVAVMEALVRQKFEEHPDLADALARIDGIIQEGNYHGDAFWGVDFRTGKGENHLGKILMRIRDEIASCRQGDSSLPGDGRTPAHWRGHKADVYERITGQIVSELEKGVRPWFKPWKSEHAAGRITRPLRGNGIPYRGINVLMLWSEAMSKAMSRQSG